MHATLDESPDRLAARLRAEGRSRAWAARLPADAEQLQASTPWLAEAVAALPDCDGHEAVFLEVAPQSGALFGAFLHRTARGQGQGGLRCWDYASALAFLGDGLRLARGMGRKSALAGLWWGGGKGVIALPPGAPCGDAGWRRRLFAEYGDFVTSLRGCYVTAEDAGTTPEDMRSVYSRTRFVTCVPEELGGSGNPAPMTAAGVLCAIEAALEWLGEGGLEGKRIAMQGAGNVAGHMVRGLLERGVASIVVSETNAGRRAALLDHCDDPRLRVVQVRYGDHSILAQPCDVLVPNALGGVLDPKTIPTIQARLVCGAANNVLADDLRDGEALAARGIALVPDFVANRMGIVSCCNEHTGRVHPDPAVEAQLDREHPHGIHQGVQRVLAEARRLGVSPTTAANALADAVMEEPHPIHGQRTRRIVASLVERGWADEVPGG